MESPETQASRPQPALTWASLVLPHLGRGARRLVVKETTPQALTGAQLWPRLLLCASPFAGLGAPFPERPASSSLQDNAALAPPSPSVGPASGSPSCSSAHAQISPCILGNVVQSLAP